MLGTSIVISVAATGEVAVGDVPVRLPRTATTSPTFTALNFTDCSSRLYVVEELVVTLTFPASVRSVSVEPLIWVTVPVSPPQNPPPKKEGTPNPAPANSPSHPAPKPPPGPKDGRWVDGDGLGLLVAAVAFAAVGDAARVTINPAVAPSTAMASPIPATRNRLLRLAGGSTGGGGGGGSGKSGLISARQRTSPTCRKGY